MCTLHSFPHNIDHCLTFARSEFEGLLEKSPAEAIAFLLDPAKCVGPTLHRAAAQHTQPWHCCLVPCCVAKLPTRSCLFQHSMPPGKLLLLYFVGTWMRQSMLGTAQRVSGWSVLLRCSSPSAAAPSKTAWPGHAACSRCNSVCPGLAFQEGLVPVVCLKSYRRAQSHCCCLTAQHSVVS